MLEEQLTETADELWQTRSRELADWVRGKSPDELVRGIASMPKKLRKELFAEAMRDDRVVAVYNMELPVGFDSQSRETIALKKYCQLPEVYGFVPLELPGMNTGNVPSSNIIDTSSLFGVQQKRLPERPHFNHHVIYSRNGTIIEYSGDALYQLDWNVLNCLICLSKDGFNKVHTVKPREILRILGLQDHGHEYDMLFESIRRLREAYVYVENNSAKGNNTMRLGCPGSSKHKTATGLNLVAHFVWHRGLDLQFALDMRLVRLFGNSEYGLIDWQQRHQIRHNELAMKLQCLLSGQKANQQFHSVGKIRALTGLNAEFAQFVRQLKKALGELMANGIIVAYWISKPKKGEGLEKKMICVWRKDGPSSKEPVPTARGLFVSRPLTGTEAVCEADPEAISPNK